jgi:hypothetical protein
MLNEEQFNQAKLNQIEAKAAELDKLLERNLVTSIAALEARKALAQVIQWSAWSLTRPQGHL